MKIYVDMQALKSLLTVRRVLEHSGWRAVWSRGVIARGPCPIHRSSSSSSRIMTITQTAWHCHRCHAGGDVIRLWARLTGTDDYTAAVDLVRVFGIDPAAVSPPAGSRNRKRHSNSSRDGRD